MTAAESQNAPASAASNWALIKQMLLLGWQHRSTCVVLLVLNVVLVGLNLSGLGLTGLAIDVLRNAVEPNGAKPQWPLGIHPPHDWSTMAVITVVALSVLATAIVLAALKFLVAVVGASLSQAIVIQLRTDVYDKLQRLSFRFFDTNDSSSLINRVAGDVQAVRGFVDGVILKILTVIFSLTFYFAYMLSTHMTLAIACLITSPLLWIGGIWFSRSVRPRYRRSGELGDKLVMRLAENIQGIEVIKGFAREADEVARFHSANTTLKDQKNEIFWRLSLYQPSMGFLTQISQLTLIGYGGLLVIRGELPLGTGLFVFANLIQEFANQVGHVINIANSIQASLTAAERVFEILDAEVEIRNADDAVPLKRARGEVTFDDVSFSYDIEEQGTIPLSQPRSTAAIPSAPALSHITMKIPAGKCIGIIGETGSGKTTLLQMLARFHDVTEGRVLVDGIDVRKIDLQDLRQNIGIVFQESFLFSNTVAANIAFGKPDSMMSDIERAANLASAAEFISQLPDGYDNLVGEHGSNLSGGQRQRLAIARALLLDPPILILDDATAAVDAETEHEIQQAIETGRAGRTTILVSSRISAIRHADQIYLLRQGRVVESGTHAELIRLDGDYCRLARLQYAVDNDFDFAAPTSGLDREAKRCSA